MNSRAFPPQLEWIFSPLVLDFLLSYQGKFPPLLLNVPFKINYNLIYTCSLRFNKIPNYRIAPAFWSCRPHAAQDGYECGPMQNHKFTYNLFFFCSSVFVYLTCGPETPKVRHACLDSLPNYPIKAQSLFLCCFWHSPVSHSVCSASLQALTPACSESGVSLVVFGRRALWTHRGSEAMTWPPGSDRESHFTATGMALTAPLRPCSLQTCTNE